MDDDKTAKYDVGYKKTPVSTRFKAGQSGNPNGRPKGSKNFATEIDAELNARVPVTENGKRKKISKRRVIAKQLVNKGVSGDPKAMDILLKHDRTRDGESISGSSIPPEAVDAADQTVMDSIIDRLLRMHGVERSVESIGQPESETVPDNEQEGEKSDVDPA